MRVQLIRAILWQRAYSLTTFGTAARLQIPLSRNGSFFDTEWTSAPRDQIDRFKFMVGLQLVDASASVWQPRKRPRVRATTTFAEEVANNDQES